MICRDDPGMKDYSAIILRNTIYCSSVIRGACRGGYQCGIYEDGF